MKKQNIFVDSVNMETQTVFRANGDIIIYPCDYERGQQIVANGTIASQKGRMITQDDGTSHFKPYRHDSGSRYKHLFSTPHGEVKETAKNMIFTLRFPKRISRDKMETLLLEETEMMRTFIKSHKKGGRLYE